MSEMFCIIWNCLLYMLSKITAACCTEKLGCNIYSPFAGQHKRIQTHYTFYHQLPFISGSSQAESGQNFFCWVWFDEIFFVAGVESGCKFTTNEMFGYNLNCAGLYFSRTNFPQIFRKSFFPLSNLYIDIYILMLGEPLVENCITEILKGIFLCFLMYVSVKKITKFK